ncbi:uncharacterized protein F5147DRAFT_725361, partial [Suillus discolor]
MFPIPWSRSAGKRTFRLSTMGILCTCFYCVHYDSHTCPRRRPSMRIVFLSTSSLHTCTVCIFTSFHPRRVARLKRPAGMADWWG